MDPDALSDAVRPLIPDGPRVLGAFEVKEISAGDEGFALKVVVAWNAEEVFVFSASMWKGQPMELLGRMPLTTAMVADESEIPEWDGVNIVIGGASYRVRAQHASEADRLFKSWVARKQRARTSG